MTLREAACRSRAKFVHRVENAGLHPGRLLIQKLLDTAFPALIERGHDFGGTVWQLLRPSIDFDCYQISHSIDR
jgi:hypothetical protein